MTNDNQATDLYISKYCESRIQTIGRNIDIGVTQGCNKSEGGSGLVCCMLYKPSHGDLEYSLFINTRSHNGC